MLVMTSTTRTCSGRPDEEIPATTEWQPEAAAGPGRAEVQTRSSLRY